MTPLFFIRALTFLYSLFVDNTILSLRVLFCLLNKYKHPYKFRLWELILTVYQGFPRFSTYAQEKGGLQFSKPTFTRIEIKIL